MKVECVLLIDFLFLIYLSSLIFIQFIFIIIYHPFFVKLIVLFLHQDKTITIFYDSAVYSLGKLRCLIIPREHTGSIFPREHTGQYFP